jgi:hypothetical protein
MGLLLSTLMMTMNQTWTGWNQMPPKLFAQIACEKYRAMHIGGFAGWWQPADSARSEIASVPRAAPQRAIQNLTGSAGALRRF